VNYSLRPAKAAERKMLCDVFRRLEPFGRIHTYRYVGFGSIYFADLQLFHQALGISEMISIEKDETNGPRFTFNRPFRCVDLRLGHSNSVLPQLEWETQSLVWLDYDGRLDGTVLADVAMFCSKAVSGSFLLVSVNVEPERKPGATPQEQDAFRLQKFSDAVGSEKVPLEVTGVDLRAGELAKVCRRVIHNEILKELADRNGPLEEDRKFYFRQLVHFQYADDAQMLTVGGLLYEKREEALLRRCGFDELPFVRDSEDAVVIRAPRLTQKEVRSLNAQLPRLPRDEVMLPGIPDSDVRDYASIYRYYPSFGEVLLG
jgi:hypothetical protein